MPASSILLRIVLSLALVMNGWGYAMASVNMQMGHAGMASSAMERDSGVDAVAEPPCHQQTGGASDSVAQVPDPASDAASVESGHPASDCCTSGVCQCACVSQAQALNPVYLSANVEIERADLGQAPRADHIAPALPHLMRPPIG